MTNPVLSIIIPCYNVQDYVQEALQSILDNTSQPNYQRLELIIINDGSTDQTYQKIQTFISQIASENIRHTVINQANAGLSAARNAGMAIATGEYWLFLDSDDIFINQAIDQILDNIKKYQPDVIEFDATKFTDTVFDEKDLYNDYFNKLADLDIQQRRLMAFEENRWYVWSRCYNSKLFIDKKFEEGKLFEDMMTIPYCYLETHNISVLPVSLVGYRQRNNSIVATFSHRHLKDIFFALEKSILAETSYPAYNEELLLFQYKNWRMIIAESIRMYLKTRDVSYLKNLQQYRNKIYNVYGKDLGWQIGYFTKVAKQKMFRRK